MPSFWKNRKVLITGHTGFKGSWLSLWLQQLGATPIGYALTPPTTPNLFEEASVTTHMISETGDIRDLDHLRSFIEQTKPEIIIHMAAQSLVRESYSDPVNTYATNVMGTVNILEAARLSDSTRAVVNVTSDKCYENKEWGWATGKMNQWVDTTPIPVARPVQSLLPPPTAVRSFKKAKKMANE